MSQQRECYRTDNEERFIKDELERLFGSLKEVENDND